jgi:hypothetical protein
MDNIEKSYRLLLYIQHNLNKEKLEQIYNTEMGSHLWEKFLYYDRNLLIFLNYLDKNNKEIFFNAMRDENNNILIYNL